MQGHAHNGSNSSSKKDGGERGRKGEGKGERREIIAGTENVSCNRKVTIHHMFLLIIICSLKALKALKNVFLSISFL